MSPCNHRITLTHTKTHTRILSVTLSLFLMFAIGSLARVHGLDVYWSRS